MAESLLINEENQKIHESDNGYDSDFNLDDYIDTSSLQINNSYNNILRIIGDNDYILTYDQTLQNEIPIEDNQFVELSIDVGVVESNEPLAVTPVSLIENNAIDATIDTKTHKGVKEKVGLLLKIED